MSEHEHRIVRPSAVEVRQAPGGGPHEVTATVVTYNQPDEYATSFAPGVFTESLAERMPRIVWAHDWTDPIGRWVEVVEDSDAALVLRGELDDPLEVPTAKRALAQLRSGTIDQFSVGFLRQADEDDPDNPGITRITRASLDEVSLVVSGAVPGTNLVSVRSGTVDERLVIDLARQVGAGTLTKADAIMAIDLASGGTPEMEPPEATDPEALAMIADAQAEADAALG